MSVREIIRSKAKPTQAAWAKANGISPAYVSDVIAGRREPGQKILDALGLERVTTYRPKPSKAPSSKEEEVAGPTGPVNK